MGKGKTLEEAKKIPHLMKRGILVDIRDRRLYETYDRNLTKKLEGKLLNLDVSGDTKWFTENSLSILTKRYFISNEAGEVTETLPELFARVSANIAYVDIVYGSSEKQVYNTAQEFYKMMISRDFMANSPTLMNAGRGLQQLSACFVLPIEDKMESILGTMRDAGMVHKSGGGTGFFLGDMRMANDIVSSTYGLSSGPVRFLEAYDATTHAVNQGGTRRGANMGVMQVDHPDITQFIKLKTKEGTCANFNLSVSLTDEFMDAVERDEWYTLRNPRKGEIYNLKKTDIEKIMRAVKINKINLEDTNFYIDDKGNVVENSAGLSVRFNENEDLQLKAKEVFDYIVDCAWKLGEPGVIFIDKINRCNPTPHLGKIKATNPCGEQPLLPYEACNLGSINLANFIENRKLDKERLKKIVRHSVHFLDNVIDMSKFPIGEITEMVHKTRKIGLGVMGWADALIKLNIPYDSEKAVSLAEEVMKVIDNTAKDESEKIAKEKGVFPTYFGSIYEGKRLMRNATVTTIAPAGTISKIAGETSAGIEPNFSLVYTHTDADGTKRVTVIPTLRDDLKSHGFKDTEITEIIEKLKGKKGEDGKWVEKPKRLSEIGRIPEDIKRVYRDSKDVSVEYHIRMQAAFQKHTDNAISKTINFPHSATKEDISKAYFLARKLGCKGLTVYRDESREKQVLTIGAGGLEGKVEEIVWIDVDMGSTSISEGDHEKYYKIKKGEDTFHLTIVGEFWEDKNGRVYILPAKMFQNMKPLGTEESAEFAQSGLDRTGRLQSEDVNWVETIKELKSVTGDKIRGVGPSRLNSPSHGVGLCLEHYCLMTGIIRYEEESEEHVSHDLVNTIQKKDLKRIVDPEIRKRLRKSLTSGKVKTKHRIYENIQERFECPECHCTEFHKEEGCSDSVCNECGWSAGKCG